MDQDPGMWWTQNVVMFFLVLCRVGSMVMVAPMFSSRSIPVQLKAGFAAAVSLVIFPIVRPAGVAVPMEMVGLTTAALGEMIIGLVLGFGAAIVFVGIEMGGTLISRHMGTALANVFNPLFSSSSPAPRHLKLSTSDFTTRFHPSAKMNSNSLNGSEISTGGSINMPIEIRMPEMTMSMIRNGR